MFCVYDKLYSEIENIKYYEMQHDKYVTYSYKGRNGWLKKKTWRSVVGKRACSLFQLTDSITME